MSIEAWAVIAAIVAVVAALALTKIAADALMMAALTLLVVLPVPGEDGWRLGIIGLRDGLRGFSNTGMLTVAVLFVVVAGPRGATASPSQGEAASYRAVRVKAHVVRERTEPETRFRLDASWLCASSREWPPGVLTLTRSTTRDLSLGGRGG